MSYRCTNSMILCWHFLHWGSLLSDNFSWCQVDIKLVSRELLWPKSYFSNESSDSVSSCPWSSLTSASCHHQNPLSKCSQQNILWISGQSGVPLTARRPGSPIWSACRSHSLTHLQTSAASYQSMQQPFLWNLQNHYKNKPESWDWPELILWWKNK